MRILLLCLFVAVASANQGCITYPCASDVAGADIVFLIDTSDTMGSANLVAIQNVLYGLVGDFLKIGNDPDSTRMAFITYSQNAVNYGGLENATSPTALNNTISSLTLDGFGFREITKALVNENSTMHLRPTAKKLLVAFISNSFTGVEPSANGLLDGVRSKYDALLAVGVGPKAVSTGYDDVTTFSGTVQDALFATSTDQIIFARFWIVMNACKSYQASTPTVPTTPAVTQPTGLPCTLNNLAFDIYLVVDTSSAISSTDFTALKQSISNFVREYSVNNGMTQFGLVGVSVDPQRYYTGFHAGQTTNMLLNAFNLLAQEPSSGQAFNLALKVIEAAFLQTYATDSKTQLVVYFSGNTNFDVDSTYISSLKSKYHVNFVTVQYTTNADKNKLTQISGGSDCTIVATDTTTRPNLGFNLEKLTCRKTFC